MCVKFDDPSLLSNPLGAERRTDAPLTYHNITSLGRAYKNTLMKNVSWTWDALNISWTYIIGSFLYLQIPQRSFHKIFTVRGKVDHFQKTKKLLTSLISKLTYQVSWSCHPVLHLKNCWIHHHQYDHWNLTPSHCAHVSSFLRVGAMMVPSACKIYWTV